MLIFGGDYVAIFFKDSRIILILLIVSIFIFGMFFLFGIYNKHKKEENMVNNMVQLELLNNYNKLSLLDIDHKDIPAQYVSEISAIISFAEHREKHNIEIYCYTIKYTNKYVGMILLEKVTNFNVISNLTNDKILFKIKEFIIDTKYQHIGIGSASLIKALEEIKLVYSNATFLAECRADNDTAISFYEKLKFKNIRTLNKSGYDYFIMLK